MVFLNYFFPDAAAIASLAQPLLKWVVLLTAAAMLFAALNLLSRHLRNLPGSAASGLLLLGFALAFVAGLLPEGFFGGLGGWFYQWLIAPGLAALFALLPIFLVYALFHRLQVKHFGMVLFVVSMLLVLVGQMPGLVESFPVLSVIRHDILIGPAAAAFRGVLIGIALGVILTVLTRIRLRS